MAGVGSMVHGFGIGAHKWIGMEVLFSRDIASRSREEKERFQGRKKHLLPLDKKQLSCTLKRPAGPNAHTEQYFWLRSTGDGSSIASM